MNKTANHMPEPGRLDSLDHVATDVQRPQYLRDDCRAGIVHIGVGAFHRAHQAVYTDDALASAGGDWRILGVSLRSTQVADALNAQNGLYTLIERGPHGPKARIIGSIASVIAGARDRGDMIAALTSRAIKIVSLTVTEKAYGIDRQTSTVELNHPANAHDLRHPRQPRGVLGIICETLRLRRQAGIEAYTVLCCDNLPDNGALLKSATLGFASRVDPELAAWIGEQVAFPATMVDRITPRSTQHTVDTAIQLTRCADAMPVETEPFRQWVIEDSFPLGRPQWEAGGAVFVADVRPYEQMKLRMLNGAHSMLAYAGFVSGRKYVRDVMADKDLCRLVRAYLAAAAATLEPLPNLSFGVYAGELAERFSNPAIAHETYQIAMDGTEKLPQRILSPAAEAHKRGQDIDLFAFAVASWMRYCLGYREDGSHYPLQDPAQQEISTAVQGMDKANKISDALHKIGGLVPDSLVGDPAWRSAVETNLDRILRTGIAGALHKLPI